MRDKIREVKFNRQTLKFVYRDDSDLSVIDEFFVDHMYRAAEFSIFNSQFSILDIGAHMGAFSIYASAINPQSQIVAIEPEPDNFELLKANLKLNHCENVKTIQAAMIPGNELNTNLYISKNTHNHSTLRPCSGQALPLGTNCIQVPAVNLNHLIKEHKIKKNGLLKMDIEGAEFDVIKALKHENFKTIEDMVIEYHESNKNKRTDIENLIREHGFSVEHFPNKFDKRFGLLVCRNKR